MNASARAPLDAGALLEQLVVARVEFVVIGGIAAVLHGSAQATFDLDVCYATNPGNLETLGQVLLNLHARLKGVDEQLPFVPDARTLSQTEVLTMVTDAGELDVLARPAGSQGYAALRSRAERFDIGAVTVLVASVEDLIAMKRAAGRTKDLAAAEELQAIQRLRQAGG
ncbi:MAG: nucleotidyltransferase [Actinomycetota bacterium]|nr:nucleotidyltransferase [Actinomycetota bacterium]